MTIARPFNNYGPGLKLTDRRVIPDLARDVLDGRDLTLLSDGSATRTFCYVTDAVSGYYKVLVNGRPGEPYNVGTEEPEISVGELAERITALARDHFGYDGKPSTARVMKPTTSSTIRRGAVRSLPRRGTSWATVRP